MSGIGINEAEKPSMASSTPPRITLEMLLGARHIGGGGYGDDNAVSSYVDLTTYAFHGDNSSEADGETRATSNTAWTQGVINSHNKLAGCSLGPQQPDHYRYEIDDDIDFQPVGTNSGHGLVTLGHLLSTHGALTSENAFPLPHEALTRAMGVHWAGGGAVGDDDNQQPDMWGDDVAYMSKLGHAAAGGMPKLGHPPPKLHVDALGTAASSAAASEDHGKPLAASNASARLKRKAHHLDPPVDRYGQQATLNMARTSAGDEAETFSYVTSMFSLPQVDRIVDNVGIHDFREGNGVPAEDGDIVCLRYRAWANPSQIIVADFTTGPPFKTKLGSGEVVQGLDIGVRGMKVSGKRQLVIPWILGYGDEQVGLVPPKSTLTIVMVLDAIMKR